MPGGRPLPPALFQAGTISCSPNLLELAKIGGLLLFIAKIGGLLLFIAKIGGLLLFITKTGCLLPFIAKIGGLLLFIAKIGGLLLLIAKIGASLLLIAKIRAPVESHVSTRIDAHASFVNDAREKMGQICHAFDVSFTWTSNYSKS